MPVHELLASYALDALEPHEGQAFERHLAACPQCRRELRSFAEAGSALAFAVAATPPPPELWHRIARDLRPRHVVQLRARRIAYASAALAAAAAVAVAIWATGLSRSLDRERAARGVDAALVGILATPGASTVPLDDQTGSLVVAPTGDAALVVSNLTPAGPNHVYEAWVIERGRPRAAGLFDGGPGRSALVLTRRVPRGATVAVTLQRRDDVVRMSPPVLFGAHAS